MKQTERGNVKRIACGAAIALVAELALLSLASLLLVRGRVGEGSAPLCVWLCAFLSAFAGAKAASWGAAKPLALSAETVAAAYCVMVLLGFLMNDSLDALRLAKLGAAMAAGCACASVLRVRKNGKKHVRRSRR